MNWYRQEPHRIHDVDGDGFTPLALAVVFADLPMAKYFVEAGADLNRNITNGRGLYGLIGVASANKDLAEMKNWLKV